MTIKVNAQTSAPTLDVFRGGELVEWIGVPGKWRVIPSNVYDDKYVAIQRERGNRIYMGVPCEELKHIRDMTRPSLELSIYPKLEPPVYGHQIEGYRAQWKAENAERIRKRLTDTELAAEVFRQAAWIGADGRAHKTDEGRNIVFEAAFTFGPMTRDEHEYLTVSRFATLPHYDEQDNP